MAFDASTAALVGAVGVGLLSFAGTYLSNRYAWTREREARQGDIEKWHREQLQSGLVDATAAVNRYCVWWLRHNQNIAEAQKDPELVNLNADLRRAIVTILLHYPYKAIPEYQDLVNH